MSDRTAVNGLATMLVVALAGGCAVGQRIDYSSQTPRLRFHGTGVVAVAAHDRRKEVVTGRKTATFVGVLRGGFGNAFDLNTESGDALAVDFAGDIVTAFSTRGYKVVAVPTTARQSAKDVALAVTKTGAPRSLIVQITQWTSDTYQNTALHYALSARVIDPRGEQLASAMRSGDRDLGGSFGNPAAHAKSAVPEAFRDILEQLLNDPDIVEALQGAPPSPPANPPEPPTVSDLPPAPHT